jgi:hypothetical protein
MPVCVGAGGALAGAGATTGVVVVLVVAALGADCAKALCVYAALAATRPANPTKTLSLTLFMSASADGERRILSWIVSAWQTCCNALR